ncbi:DUF2388 domain-containing protein [Pseudomonas sp. Au-Pse12]|uniref:DUF2388 domain-containing protein n=1 Tax=Pseudomonas sp. Au-Pse12 TaxID=2906459 RepID=UPI001E4883F8|nr:DUF2388 domain-containing protein [Pseudomonas sp. Au-Pse12]MCE4057107.1 DUF2388 domain-containing protein [Pseudomonas sp. Au-Pse12]
MAPWKALAVSLLVSVSIKVSAYEIHDPVERTLVVTTLAPSVLVVATTGLTSLASQSFKPAKADALAFVGSGGEIRGAQFEQAVQYYHPAHGEPYMTDEQLALAIATTF